MDRKRSQNCFWLLDFIEVVTRIWGVVNVIVMWGVGVDVTIHHQGLGAYILQDLHITNGANELYGTYLCSCAVLLVKRGSFIAVLLTVLETSFAVNIYLDFAMKDEKNLCFRCWQGIQWLDLWKKTILYLFLSIFCFLKPSKVWLATLGGSFLISLALLYLLFAYKVHLTEEDNMMYDKDCSYDRFADLQDEIDDSLPEISSGNVGDQDTILQV